MTMLRIVIETDSLRKHSPWFEHPENPGRIKYVIDGIKRNGLTDYTRFVKHSYEEKEVLQVLNRVHCRKYIEYIMKCRNNAPCQIDPDTYFSETSYELALETFDLSYNTGLSIGEQERIFLIMRPPGHHAGKCGKAFNAPTQGFCIFNNAAATVLGFKDRGFKRVAILDIDVHHGNGTQEIFYKNNDVLHIDIHRNPHDFYPFTGFPEDIGMGRGRGYSVNFIVLPHTGDDSYIHIVDYAFKLIQLYGPEALIVSAGFDGYKNDGLADLDLSQYSYYYIGRKLSRIDVPVVIVLEGGYGLGLIKGIPALLNGLLGIEKQYSTTITNNKISLYNLMIARKIFDTITKVWRQSRE
ncbi:histone deacetylase superfamily [Staphylothermus marinus F1]|uniref:Histone deacetylase superfamily n=2 Tax=Staphylothermus marinus TaxID=2280 RepID=A3DNS7_STAMF|nr:histone deacetylase superfamily [Staphylothermus marinus F1]